MEPRILAGRYEMIERIGSGGMGTVWRARDSVLGRDVAVKLLNEGLAQDAGFAERFRREARAAASLAHPNIVAVYDTGAEDAVPFIVMELVEGSSLHERLRGGALPVDETVRIGVAVAGALAHAHERGLVHRDMKPANVLIETSTGEVKVADFGIAKGAEDTGGLTRTGTLLGTAAYLSPEQAAGRPATAASDLYALGCLLYACLAGEPPFTGESPVAIAMSHVRDPVPSLRGRRADTPPSLEAVVMHALAKEPGERFAHADQMRSAIAGETQVELPATQVMTPAGTSPAAPAATEHLVIARPSRDRRTGRLLATITAILVVAAAALIALTYVRTQRPTVDPSGPTDAPLVLPTTPQPTSTPTQTPEESTPQPTFLDLPGINIGGSSPAETPSPTPSPTSTP